MVKQTGFAFPHTKPRKIFWPETAHSNNCLIDVKQPTTSHLFTSCSEAGLSKKFSDYSLPDQESACHFFLSCDTKKRQHKHSLSSGCVTPFIMFANVFFLMGSDISLK